MYEINLFFDISGKIPPFFHQKKTLHLPPFFDGFRGARCERNGKIPMDSRCSAFNKKRQAKHLRCLILLMDKIPNNHLGWV